MHGKRLLAFMAVTLMATTSTAIPQIAADPNLVYVHVAALDRLGRFVTGLPKERLQITEDKLSQQIVYFSGEDVPISVGVLPDVRGDLKNLVNAVSSTLMKDPIPGSEFFLVEATDTPINDAVYQGLNKVLQIAKNTRRAFVLFTDRSDPGGYSFSNAKDLLRDQDIQLYVIGVSELGYSSDEEKGRLLLRDLAEMSGGRSFFLRNVTQIESIVRTVALELKNQYVIGYRPTNVAKDGKWRKIKVTGEYPDKNKKIQKLTIRAKPGYYAPTVVETTGRQ